MGCGNSEKWFGDGACVSRGFPAVFFGSFPFFVFLSDYAVGGFSGRFLWEVSYAIWRGVRLF